MYISFEIALLGASIFQFAATLSIFVEYCKDIASFRVYLEINVSKNPYSRQ